MNNSRFLLRQSVISFKAIQNKSRYENCFELSRVFCKHTNVFVVIFSYESGLAGDRVFHSSLYLFELGKNPVRLYYEKYWKERNPGREEKGKFLKKITSVVNNRGTLEITCQTGTGSKEIIKHRF